jgi:DNA-binding beta-propeller fold protein YncE
MRLHPALVPVFALIVACAGRAVAVPAVTATVPIGPRPVAVAVDGSDHRVYVADVDLGAVVTFDGVRGTIVGQTVTGGQPASLAVDSQGRRLFVGNRDSVGTAAVSVIDTAAGQARAFLPAGHPVRGLAFDAEIDQLYVGDATTGELMVVDGQSAQVLDRVPLGGTPVSIAVNPSNGEVAVAVQGTAPALAVVDPSNRGATPVRVPVGDGQPLFVDVDSGTGKFFVTRGGANPALLVLRPGSSQFDNAIPIAPGVTGLTVDSRTSRIYLAQASPNLATVIDGATGTAVAVVPLDAGANHASLDPTSTPTRVYMVDSTNGLLTVLTDQ